KAEANGCGGRRRTGTKCGHEPAECLSRTETPKCAVRNADEGIDAQESEVPARARTRVAEAGRYSCARRSLVRGKAYRRGDHRASRALSLGAVLAVGRAGDFARSIADRLSRESLHARIFLRLRHANHAAQAHPCLLRTGLASRRAGL